MAATAALKLSKHGAEGAHWYTEHGDMVLEVLKADGSGYTRPTLAHARKHQLAPGCTGVIGQVKAPNLILWMQRQAVLAALTLPRREAESENDWLARVEEDMNSIRDKAAAEGKRVHTALEAHWRNEPFDDGYREHVAGIAAEMDRVLGKQTWNSEVVVVSRLGFATKIDALSPEWSLNFKGKDGSREELAKIKLYDEHGQQSAAELHALGQQRRCAHVFFSRTHRGHCHIVEVKPQELDRGLYCFRHLLGYWQEKNEYRPSWVSEMP